MDFQQSRTYQNLLNAYDYELMSSTIFELYADQARRETLIEISNVFDIITRNNKELARIWLRQINQGVLLIPLKIYMPVSKLKITLVILCIDLCRNSQRRRLYRYRLTF